MNHERIGEGDTGGKVDPGFKRQVRVAAAKRDMTMSEYMILAIENQLEADGELED